MDNLETLLEELERFEKKGGDGTSKVLEEYLQYVAKTGDTLFPWHRIRYFMRFMLATVMNDFYENCGGEDVSECTNLPAFSYVPTRDKILHHFDTFSGAPFTIQRLCEIMIDPTRHYKRTDKFLRGLEKNILVVTYTEPGRHRRSEDPQQTLVNGMQDGGLHSSPVSGSSRLSSPSHQSKRISSPQPTNSISNSANDFYDSEINAGESHVSGSEANGPNGIPMDERGLETLSENIEPPVKKSRTDLNHSEKASGSVERLSHLQEKDSPYMSISEAESLEAEGSDEESNASSSSSSSAKTDEEAMETGEAEATCQSENEDNKVLEETLCGHQVGTSEASLQESDADEDTTEACSSDMSNAQESEESKDDSNSLSSESSGSAANHGSPDSVEDTSEQTHHQQEETVSRGERACSSEATAAELDSISETDDVTEGASTPEEPNEDSHEADSTSQAHSNNFCTPVVASGVGSSTSVTSCTPSTASTCAASTVSPVASPPSDTGGPTTSRISASASSPQMAAASSVTHRDSSVRNSSSFDDASTTSSSSELDSAEEVASNNDASDEIGTEVSSDITTKNVTDVSCSSSLTDKSDVREEPMEED